MVKQLDVMKFLNIPGEKLYELINGSLVRCCESRDDDDDAPRIKCRMKSFIIMQQVLVLDCETMRTEILKNVKVYLCWIVQK